MQITEKKREEFICHIRDLIKQLTDILEYVPANFTSYHLREIYGENRPDGEIIEEFGFDQINMIKIQGVAMPGNEDKDRNLTLCHLAPIISDLEQIQPNSWSLALDCTGDKPNLINLKNYEGQKVEEEEEEEEESVKFDTSETLETDLALLSQNPKAVEILTKIISALKIVAESRIPENTYLGTDESNPKIENMHPVHLRNRRIALGDQREYRPSNPVEVEPKPSFLEKIKKVFR